jgi:ribosomal subunit interface protein
MPIEVTGRHIELGESLIQQAKEKVQNLLTHFFKNMEDIPAAHVIFSKERQLFKVDISVHISRYFQAHCRGEADEAHLALRMALQKLEKQVSRHRHRIIDRKHHHHVDSEDVRVLQEYMVESDREGEINEYIGDHPVTIAETDFPIQILSVSDAIMRLELSEKQLLVFTNKGSGELNIVHKREDHNIGWIDLSKNKIA